ncbi:hypothetical protein [uncultured Jatrophihabitans sp.]|uniref:hypothetical protein n=1 Tax=uncultured Jatrophihabitans sp. TaxID=1610747 RepID=UPI0035CC813D
MRSPGGYTLAMTGFDETVPPDLDPDADATSAEDVGDNVIAPSGGPVPGHAVDDADHDPAEHRAMD